jgi:hypothetical protein
MLGTTAKTKIEHQRHDRTANYGKLARQGNSQTYSPKGHAQLTRIIWAWGTAVRHGAPRRF